ncbi:MAG: S41 family peptidase [bacterium]
MNKKQKFINIIIALLIIAVSSYGGYWFGSTKEIIITDGLVNGTTTTRVIVKDKTPPIAIDNDIDFSQFWDIWSLLKNEYVEKNNIEDKELFYGAIEGMVASLKDPYTVYLKPKIAKEFTDELSGEFEGIGAEVGIKHEILTIISPLPDTPAEKAGLKPGDKVYAINGEETMGMYIDVAVSKIRGKAGTDVVLKILRERQRETLDIKITRGAIKFDSVRWELRDDGVAYVKVLHFNTDTVDKFSEAVNDIVKAKPKGIILDLRGNPGGFLDAAVKMASEWVEDGVVVTEKYSEEKKKEHDAIGRARLTNYKTVVLINKGSASGSEIVAGALKDLGYAVLVGEKTFGKGSVQSLEEFGDGSSLKMTVAKWLTPNGNCINETGIEPDVAIELTDEDYNEDRDPQMERAVEILAGNNSKAD